MQTRRINNILVEEGAEEYAFTQSILSRLSGVPVHPVKRGGVEECAEKSEMGKDTLQLLPFMGEYLKPCPGTRAYICCGYQILNIATNCPLDCSYCILQSYFNRPNLKVYVNYREELEKVFHIIDSNPEKIFRVGTGEFTDSLALDGITRISNYLVPRFSNRKNAVLEFKTKTDQVDGLLACRHRDRIVVSWSLNSPYIASREEHKAANLKKRLQAAGRCQSEGFAIGLHFDPLIPHPNWKEEYLKTIELIDQYLNPKRIIWTSLGSFRFMPVLKSIIRIRHPKTHVLDGEFVKGLDGKMRYFKPIRINQYAYMKEVLEKWFEDIGLYLCMESDDVWQKAFGWSPVHSSGLATYLDSRVVKIFG